MSVTCDDDSEPPAPSVLAADGEERYEMIDVCGEGGMGRVLSCEDRMLGRRVAIKIARPELRDGTALLEREARILGLLEHPNIVPIYDLSHDESCGVFYVMRLLPQPTLADALRRLRKRERKVTHGRLLRMFIQVCQAVAFAHSRGVVHCDLKPENVLLGGYGEVFVADWGFAHRIGKDEDHGSAGGTGGYMPPEQLDRKPLDGRTDVFALGVILYQLLTDTRPFEAIDFATWRGTPSDDRRALLTAEPPSRRAPHRRVPPELDELCARALELDLDRRLDSALALARGLEAFIEGTRERKRRQKLAADLCQQAEALCESRDDLWSSRPERVAELARLRAVTPPWDSGPAREALREQEEAVAVLDALGARTAATAVSLFERALDEVPTLAPARAGLSRLHWALAEQARGRRDELERRHHEALALDHDDGTLATRLDRGGSLRLELSGVSALTVHPLVDFAPAEAYFSGAPPELLALPAGPYELCLQLVGRELRLPALVSAGQESACTLCASAVPADEGERLVPRGPCLVGGHASSLWGVELHAVELDDFVIDSLPVTFGAFAAFLDATGDAHVPRAPRSGKALLLRGPAGWEPAAAVTRDPAWQELPVFGVDVAAAEAYAAWRGPTWRLPREEEWEKAARGLDGRPCPWGDSFDATRCKTRESREQAPSPEPVGAFAADVSVYGMRDAAGGVAEWVASAGRAIAKGGSWLDWAGDCHLGARRGYDRRERSLRVGFRLARSLK